jgi:hypothetical protein
MTPGGTGLFKHQVLCETHVSAIFAPQQIVERFILSSLFDLTPLSGVNYQSILHAEI